MVDSGLATGYRYNSWCISKPKKEITFASFNYSETALFGEMVKRLVEEKTDIKVNHLPNMEFGVAVAATQTGEVDIYLTYSGTQFTTVLNQEVTEEWTDPQKVLEYVEREVDEEYDMLLMDSLGFDNTYAVAVRRDFAEEHNLTRCQIGTVCFRHGNGNRCRLSP